MSGSAFLGPTFTGFKTGSVYQTSLSYGSNKMVTQIKSKKFTKKLKIDKFYKKNNPILPDIPFVDKDPVILLAYKVDDIEFTEVIEPEPLP